MRSMCRTIGCAVFAVALLITPASAQSLAQCITGSNAETARLYADAKNTCRLQNSANAGKLGRSALKAANQSCLRTAKATNVRGLATGQATCKQNHPVLSASAAQNTLVFCRLVKAWLAAEEAGMISPNIDFAWVHSTTDPLLAMYKIAPDTILKDVGFIAQSVYSSRIGAVIVPLAGTDADYAREMGRLIGDVESGIASQSFLPSISRLSEFTKANCGLDLESELKALQEKYMP